MSQQAAQSWLSSHQNSIPALEIHHRQALQTLEDHSKTVQDLAEIIALDPGMSISLYQQVNGKLHSDGKAGVDSVHAALALLGDSAIADFVMQHQVLDATHPDTLQRQDFHQLVSRGYHMQAQLDSFIEFQGISEVNELRSAALLHNIGEYLACLFDHKLYQQYQVKFRILGGEANSAKPVFGFDFHELGRDYAVKMYLPALVIESLDENSFTGRQARLIQLAADISHQAEEGWYHPAMKATSEVCAAFLNQSPDGFDRHLQQVAIDAARSCPLDDVMPAAARLIMLPEREPPVLQENESPGIKQRVNRLLNAAQPSEVDLIELLLDFLHEDLHMSRVVLLLLTPDKRKLGTRAVRGIESDSPINTLVIDIERAGLLKQILAKPQGVWLNPENYDRFQTALPANFKQSFLQENFFLMSFFISGNPTGVVFCDRAHTVNKPDRASYVTFKKVVHLISIALTQLAERRRRQAKPQGSAPQDQGPPRLIS